VFFFFFLIPKFILTLQETIYGFALTQLVIFVEMIVPLALF
jgi:hypothetical protein